MLVTKANALALAKQRGCWSKQGFQISTNVAGEWNMAPTELSPCEGLVARLNSTSLLSWPFRFMFLSLDCNSNFKHNSRPVSWAFTRKQYMSSLVWMSVGFLRSGLIIFFSPCLITRTPKHCHGCCLIPPCSANYVVLIEVFLLRRHAH